MPDSSGLFDHEPGVFFRKKVLGGHEPSRSNSFAIYEYLGLLREDGTAAVVLFYERNAISIQVLEGGPQELQERKKVLEGKRYELPVRRGTLSEKALASKIKNYWGEMYIPWSEKDCAQLTSPRLKRNGHIRDLSRYDDKECNLLFAAVFVDFLWEVENGSLFQGSAEDALNEILLSNPFVEALQAKYDYKYCWKKEVRSRSEMNCPLSEHFLRIEERWLRCLYDPDYSDVFPYKDKDGIPFRHIEEEVRTVVLRQGKTEGKSWYRNAKMIPEEQRKAMTFFLRRYLLGDAFKVMGWSTVVQRMYVISLLILSFLVAPCARSIAKWLPPVTWLMWAPPIGALVFTLCRLKRGKVNPLQLFIPRMMYGIILGWFVFFTSNNIPETCKDATPMAAVTIAAIFVIFVGLSIYTEVKRKLIDAPYLLKRTLGVVLIALYMSVMQGHYFLQFFGRGGFPGIEKYQTGVGGELATDIYFQPNYLLIGCGFAIFFGVILQMLWEDRPVTEPIE